MAEELSPLDRKIIQVAKKSFLEKGIIKTEMKHIAKEVGISRSSLYRHFPNTLYIAFHIVPEMLNELMTIYDVQFDKNEHVSGYELFAAYMNMFVEKLCNNLDIIRFVKEFDTLYNLSEQEITPPEDYRLWMDNTVGQHITYFKLGIEDGSISSELDEVKVPLTFLFTALSMTEHIMLREENYLREHGAAYEFVSNTIELMLRGIKS